MSSPYARCLGESCVSLKILCRYYSGQTLAPIGGLASRRSGFESSVLLPRWATTSSGRLRLLWKRAACPLCFSIGHAAYAAIGDLASVKSRSYDRLVFAASSNDRPWELEKAFGTIRSSQAFLPAETTLLVSLCSAPGSGPGVGGSNPLSPTIYKISYLHEFQSCPEYLARGSIRTSSIGPLGGLLEATLQES